MVEEARDQVARQKAPFLAGVTAVRAAAARQKAPFYEGPYDGPPRSTRRPPHAVQKREWLNIRYVFHSFSHSFSNSFHAHNPHLYKSPNSHTHTLILSILSKFKVLLLQVSSTQGMNPNSISELCFNSLMNFGMYSMIFLVETLII